MTRHRGAIETSVYTGVYLRIYGIIIPYNPFVKPRTADVCCHRTDHQIRISGLESGRHLLLLFISIIIYYYYYYYYLLWLLFVRRTI